MERAEKLGPWYHKIALPGGVVTPGHDWDDLWDNIRQAKRGLDYGGKRVLDVGTMDGLWAFEAEQAGAIFVVAVDMSHLNAERLLFCREQLGSTVYPYFNVRVERLVELRPFVGFFDIVQLLGVLYHLPDPFTALTQCRQMLSEGGRLIIETVAITSIPLSCLIFNGVMPCDHESGYWWRIYQGGAKPQWAPTLSCLLEMLLLAGFIPDTTSLSLLNQPPTHGINSDDPSVTYQRARIALTARAAIREEITTEVIRSVLKKASRK
jgi:SAM-dependent methyltransferase